MGMIEIVAASITINMGQGNNFNAAEGVD